MQLYIRKIYFLILHILCCPMENIRYNNIRYYYENKIFTSPIASDGAYHTQYYDACYHYYQLGCVILHDMTSDLSNLLKGESVLRSINKNYDYYYYVIIL